MKQQLGEEGYEQFTITTRVDGKCVGTQKIHDPFVHSTVSHTLSRWEHFKQVFVPKTIRVQIAVDGSHGVMRAIMILDPEKMQRDTDEFLREMEISRERNSVEGVFGYHSVAAAAQ